MDLWFFGNNDQLCWDLQVLSWGQVRSQYSFHNSFYCGHGSWGRARAKGKDSLKHKSFSLSPLFNIILCPMHSCEASVLIYFLLAFEDTSVFT